MYEVLFSKQSGKFIQSLQKGYKDKLKEIVVQLSENPFSYPYRKIRGDDNLYRIRIGKYRLLYEVDRKNEKVYIIKMDDRKDVYKS